MTDTFYYDDMQEFDSTFAEKAYYSKKGELILITTGGNELLYTGVPQYAWSDLIEADSTGNFFQSHIRGVYDYQGESEYYFFRRNPQEADPTGNSTAAPVKVEVTSPITTLDAEMVARIGAHSIMTHPEARESLPLSSDESGREYVVSATFKTFEEAHILFSYAEAAAQHASLSVYNSEEVN